MLAVLLDRYETVQLPYGGNCRYDLGADTPDGFIRIQCKHGRLRSGAVRFNTSSSTVRWKNGGRKTYVGEADYFGVYCPELGTSYLVPVAEIGAVPGCAACRSAAQWPVRWHPMGQGLRTDLRAFGRVRTGCLRLTRTPLYLLSYEGMAAGQRLELRFTAPEAAVLPLDDPASGAEGASRTRKPRGLSSRGLPVAVTPA
jgi:hypothetical protein